MAVLLTQSVLAASVSRSYFDCQMAPFAVDVPVDSSITLGEIPAGTSSAQLFISSTADVDLQLSVTSTGKELIRSSAPGAGGEETFSYGSARITYSGYAGVEGSRGKEFVALRGELAGALTVRVSSHASDPAKGTVTAHVKYHCDGEEPASSSRGLQELTPSRGLQELTPSILWDLSRANKGQRGVDGFYDPALLEEMYIVRRGGAFEMSIVSAPGAVDCEMTDDLATDGTSPLAEQYPADKAVFTYNRPTPITMIVAVSLAVDAPVGRYLLTCKVGDFEASKKVAVLFNPYHPRDLVYMESQLARSEYIENEIGVLFQGSADSFAGYTWYYNQFDTDNFMAALWAMRRMPVADRSDPVLVSRHLTYAIGRDVVYGKWSQSSSSTYRSGQPSGGYECAPQDECYDYGASYEVVFAPDYKGWDEDCCVSPTDWSGTTSVISMWNHLNPNPSPNGVMTKVQFGQCFVYGAVLTSFGRSVGLPARTVSNFQSAHDYDENRAIDSFYTNTWTKVGGITSDSVWNFHVWSEAFFVRKDIGPNFTPTWNAWDATPQEQSAGGSGVGEQPTYQMGPASLYHIYETTDPVCPDAAAPETCVNSCVYDFDGECDDGGSGSEYVSCAFGTDCGDCGHRDASEAPSYGCYDAQFVIAETNANENIYLETTEAVCDATGPRYPEYGCVIEGGTYYERLGSYETDPWGDPYRTIGAVLATKLPGSVSADCLDYEGYNCLADGIDITTSYKPAEPSGPGVPNACVDTEGDLYQTTWCPLVGPDVVHHREEEYIDVDDSFLDSIIGADTCSDTCTWTGDGECDDGGSGAEYSFCSKGTDCADCGERVNDDLCVETCLFAEDDECDDGGEGSEYAACVLGTDCTDCGPRATRRARRALSPAAVGGLHEGGVISYAFDVAPTQHGPLVNVPGSRLSSVAVSVAVSATASAIVSCAFEAVAIGYTGELYVHHDDGKPDADASAVKRQPVQKQQLLAGETHSFTFEVTRDDYRHLSPTALDEPDGFVRVPPADSFYSLRVTTTCFADDRTSFIRKTDKMLCEPLASSGDGERVECAAKRSFYHNVGLPDLEAVDVPTKPRAGEDHTANICEAEAEIQAKGLKSCSELHELLCHTPALAERDCTPAFLNALQGRGLECTAPRCEQSVRQCNCAGEWQVGSGAAALSGSGCANPNDDPEGDWCVIVPGSCHGPGTSFGLPFPAEPARREGHYFDYCGKPEWDADQVQAVAEHSRPRWEPLAAVATIG